MNVKTILSYALGPIGSGLLGIIALPIITWIFKVEDVGRLSMLQVFTGFAVILFGIGLDQGYVREYHESLNRPSLLKNTLFPTLILFCVISFCLILVDINIISRLLFDIPDVYLSILSILTVLSAILIRYFSLILRMQENALAFSMSQLLPKILLLILVLSCLVIGVVKDANLLLTFNYLSLLIAVVVYGWNTRKDWLKALNEKLDYEKIKSLLDYSFPLFLSGLAAWGLNVADRIFLRYLSDFKELGVYSVTMSIAAGATILSTIFNTIWAPTIFKWHSEENVNVKVLQNISEILLMVIYFIIILVSLFSWVLTYFLPSSYSQVEFILAACIIGPLFYTLSEVSGIGITLTKKTKYSLYTSLTAMLINFGLCFILVPQLGASGAGISMAISMWVFYFFRTYFSNMIWRRIPNYRGFAITFLLLVIVILQCYFKLNSFYYYLILSLLLFLGYSIFKVNLVKLFFRVQNYLLEKL